MARQPGCPLPPAEAVNPPTFYKVQRNIPLPPRSGHALYPFGRMKVGDSFLAPVDKRRTVMQAAWLAGKRRGWTFKARDDRDELGKLRGVRVWRVK
jgi:hypothetical protein